MNVYQHSDMNADHDLHFLDFVQEDEKVRTADLDNEEFMKVCSLPMAERSSWLASKEEKTQNFSQEKLLYETRKALRLLKMPCNIDWKQPAELQQAYEALPTTVIEGLNEVSPLFTGKYCPDGAFSFCSAEAWEDQYQENLQAEKQNNDDDIKEQKAVAESLKEYRRTQELAL